jgi:hypothetical protein
MPADVFAGTSLEPMEQSRALWLTKEGVGETSGQAAGPSLFEAQAFKKPVRWKKTSFLRSVRILPFKEGPQFHRKSFRFEIWS